jgi:putative exosortase-associated protein (TIGR04073 family)
LQGNDNRIKHLESKRSDRRAAEILTLAASVAAAEEQTIAQHRQEQLVPGVVNFTTGWMGIPIQRHDVWKHEDWVAGLFRGPIEGPGMFVVRALAGMVEIATCPVP